jgi:hypothetical protein
LTADAIKENTNMTKNMASVHFSGLMDVNILETGKTESNMVEGNITFQADKRKSDNGFKAKK